MCNRLAELQDGSSIAGVSLTGVPGEPLSLREDEARQIAIGFLAWLCERLGKSPEEITLAIGRDSRTSGPRLMDGLMDGFGLYGCKVHDCGMAASPAMLMAAVSEEMPFDGAVMITGGHLPYNRNGLRLYSPEGRLEQEEIALVLNYASDTGLQTEKMGQPTMEGKQTHRFGKLVFEPVKGDIMTPYCELLRQRIIDASGKGSRPLEEMKITVDAGNGVGGFYCREVLKPLGADISSGQYTEPDGMFENHAPDNRDGDAINSVSMQVISAGADLGLLFSGDAGQVTLMDSRGREIKQQGKETAAAEGGIDAATEFVIRTAKLKKLGSIIKEMERITVALSGGVDSAFLIAFACMTYAEDRLRSGIKPEDRLAALSAAGPQFKEEELAFARDLCHRIGIAHKTVNAEHVIDVIRSNPSDRCYHCKREVFGILRERADMTQSTLCDGTNADDMEDYRPGYRAVKELGVRSPLLEAGLTKAEIRQTMKEMNLAEERAEYPAFACLISRIPYGEIVSREKLEAIAAAEKFLTDRGFSQMRVRCHEIAGTVNEGRGRLMARIELTRRERARMFEMMEETEAYLKELGFEYVTLDLGEYEKGRMNGLLENSLKFV